MPIHPFSDVPSNAADSAEAAVHIDADVVVADADTDADRLYVEANQRVADVAHASESFGKRLLQLIIVPGVIVGGIMLFWLIIVSMFGDAQGIPSLLTTLEDLPSGSSGNLLERPGYQERYRAAINLLGIVEAGQFSLEDREELLTRVPTLVRNYAEVDPQLSSFLAGTLGALGDHASLSLFAELLQSPEDDLLYAAVFGLTHWVRAASPLPLQSPAPPPPKQVQNVPRLSDLAPGLIEATTAADQRIRTFACLLLGSAAAPGDPAALEALYRVVQDHSPENRTAAWNAGIVMAALGDERGVPIVLTLLDRKWLASQPIEPEQLVTETLDEAAQDKVMLSVLKSAVAFGPNGETVIRIEAPVVWDAIESLAEDDPSADIRTVAQEVLSARERLLEGEEG